MIELVGQVAPPLVELIPVIGKLAALGVRAAADVGVYALGGDHERQQAQLASDVALALEAIASELALVIVIDDAHWIDAPSTEVIARLAHADAARRLALIVSYDEDRVDDRHPLARVRSAVLGSAGVRRITLDDFGREQVEALLRDRYGAVPHDRLADWLVDRTDGTPLFLQQYLATLEQQCVLRCVNGDWELDGSIEGEAGDWRLSGALASARTPATLLELVRPRVADLDDDERALLETGAVQGRRFLSSVVVRLMNQTEDEILDRLDRLEQRRRMISVEQTEDWWSDRSNLYAFDPGVVQELLYGRYARSVYERRRRHRAVAQALTALIADDRPPPRDALLQIARHLEAAGDPLAAAARLVEVADSTFAEGADRETAITAERAVALVRAALADGVDADARPHAQRLLARAIVLMLIGGEPSWRAAPAEGAGERLLALAAEATQAADASGDLALRANARYAGALVRTGYEGLHEGISSYREALELARAADDAVAEFVILLGLGHQLDSVSLKAGWDVLQEARALLHGGPLADRLDATTLEIETARLDMRIGVAAFDLGRYGEAIDLLARSADALRSFQRREEAAWGMAFLGQLYTAIGLFEAADATLRAAIALFADEHDSLGLRGYLRSLLGHLQLEWEPPRLADARAEIESARAEVTASGYIAVAPLVTTHLAELLLAEGTPQALRAADSELAAAATFGWARSVIATSSLRARVALAEHRITDALELSTQAVEELAARGGAVPATRSEEILFAHARILAAAGADQAPDYFAQAVAIVEAKAASLPDPAQRASFLERVRLSAAVVQASRETSSPDSSSAY